MRDFLDIVKNRKSVRSFSDKKIDQSLIGKIIEMATYAPTSCNQQLWNFIVVDEENLKEKMIKEAASTTLIRNAPILIVITYDKWHYKEAVQNTSLALGHLLLAAEYYKIGSCPINSYGSNTKIKKILKIPANETICCLVLLGYPDEKAQKSTLVPRRSVQEVMHINRFKEKRRIPFTYNPDDWTFDDLKNYQKYYCRKTFLGKEMDIMNNLEREIIKNSTQDIQEPLIDIFSYDGSYLREFPNIKIAAVDLTKETSDYTKAAVESNINGADRFSYIVYNDKKEKLTDLEIKTVTCIYKWERLSKQTKDLISSQIYNSLKRDGKFIIIARKSNIFLSLFLFIIKLFFGKDLRKTGIYNFFGPYKPINVSKTMKQLRKVGFKKIKWSGYFIIPPFYEEIYQMFLQYLKSGGSSYLHREKRYDFISKTLSLIIKTQRLKKAGFLGSTAVITCKK